MQRDIDALPGAQQRLAALAHAQGGDQGRDQVMVARRDH
jgi:hypothetical protein